MCGKTTGRNENNRNADSSTFRLFPLSGIFDYPTMDSSGFRIRRMEWLGHDQGCCVLSSSVSKKAAAAVVRFDTSAFAAEESVVAARRPAPAALASVLCSDVVAPVLQGKAGPALARVKPDTSERSGLNHDVPGLSRGP